MFARLLDAIRRKLGGSADAAPVISPIDPEELKEIEFQPLDPASRAAGDGTHLVCPVTRQELRKSDRLYQCAACRTTFSAAGWDFLRDVNHGRCCACGMRNTVAPLE